MKKGRRPRITLREVAKNAGVSTATASLVVRNSQLVSDKTKAKVIASMNELGYVYDRVAANFRSQSSSTIGLIIPEIANPYFSELLAGVHYFLEKKGYGVVLGTTYHSELKQDDVLETMIENRVAGLIFNPALGVTDETVTKLQKWRIPIVSIMNSNCLSDYDFVGIDDTLGAEMAVKHLITKGHQRIAYIGGSANSPSWRARKQGFLKSLKSAGLVIEDSYIINTPTTREDGLKAVKKIMKLPNPPTAIFCYNDVIALGATIGIKQLGLKPGKDIGIVGFDNIKESAIFDPMLTTVSGFPEKIGTIAADLIHKRIEGLDSKPNRMILQPELVERDST